MKVLYEAKTDFDADLSQYGIRKGVFINEAAREVYAPIAMWLEAVDLVLQRLKDKVRQVLKSKSSILTPKFQHLGDAV